MNEPAFFETIKIQEGKVCNIEWHQKRYERTLKHFGAKKIYALKDLIKQPKESDTLRCKLVYTPQNIESITYTPYQKRFISSLKLIEADIDYSFKYLDRSSLDALFNKKEECDDVLIVKDGLITDTSIANVAFFDGTKWFTPRKPLLAGTSRACHIASGRLEEADITPAMLERFSKIALLNAMIDFDIMPIKEIQKDTIQC